MSKHERVVAALNHRETDRTPVYDILLNDGVIQLLTGRFPPVGEEGLKIRLTATSAILDMTRMAGAAPVAPGEHRDADGFVHYPAGSPAGFCAAPSTTRPAHGSGWSATCSA